MRKALFLDRDGILLQVVMRGQTISSARSWEEYRILPGATEMVAEARSLGLLTILVTNQPDVARGLLSASLLEDFHRKLQRDLALDDLEVCCEDGQHPRRKPNPGMLLDAARRWELDLGGCFFLGDRRTDALAARAAGVRPVVLLTDYNREEVADFPDLLSIERLAELTPLLKSQTGTAGA